MPRTLVAVLLCIALAACASQSPRHGYRGPDAYGRCADCGTIDRIERVYGGKGYATGSGALLGAIIGGALGNTVGKGDGRAAATVAGAVVGGAIGNEAEKDANRGPRYEIFITLDSGRRVVVRQPDLGPLRDGVRVIVHDGRVERL
jgi:outer membrane lipoprotein SlyB